MPLLYGVAYAIKMSKKGPREIEGYFEFVVPPLEGFWWQDRADGGNDYARKDDFNFISCIRLPDFVNRENFDWAVSEAAAFPSVNFTSMVDLSAFTREDQNEAIGSVLNTYAIRYGDEYAASG